MTDWVSASQLDLFSSCMRKWAFRYIDKIELPPHPSAAKGSRVHATAEQYLKTGFIDINTEEGSILLPGLEHIPPPLYPGMQVEYRFGTQIGDTWVRGIKDVWIPDGPLVLDHKTTSNLQWAKTATDLLTDTQAGVYAHNALQETNSDAVNLRWVYYTTKRPHVAHVVDATITRDQLAPVQENINATGQLIQLGRKSDLRAIDYPPNPDECDSYGGCPFVGRCHPFKEEDLVEQLSFDEKLRRAVAGAAQTSAPVTMPPSGWNPEPAAAVTQATPPSAAWGPPAATQAAAAEAVQQWQEKPTAGGPAAPKKRKPKGFVLYVGCMRIGEANEDFSSRVLRIQACVAQGANVLQAIEHDFETYPPVGAVVVTPGTPLANEALAVLQPKAEFVVRAFQ